MFWALPIYNVYIRKREDHCRAYIYIYIASLLRIIYALDSIYTFSDFALQIYIYVNIYVRQFLYSQVNTPCKRYIRFALLLQAICVYYTYTGNYYQCICSGNYEKHIAAAHLAAFRRKFKTNAAAGRFEQLPTSLVQGSWLLLVFYIFKRARAECVSVYSSRGVVALYRWWMFGSCKLKCVYNC